MVHIQNFYYVSIIIHFLNVSSILFSAGWFGVVSIYVYFIVGTVINRFLISPLAKWSARVEKAEGDFRWREEEGRFIQLDPSRYKHVSVRDHSEEAAFYKAANFEVETERLLV